MNGKLQFVLCDDNPSHNRTLTYHLNEMEEMPLPFELELVTTRPQDVLDFAGMSREKGMQTVYLLDLVLEQETMSRLDVCQEIHRRDPKGYIIYVSAYAEYAMDCIKSHAFDFVLKPYTPERLENAARDVMREIARQEPEVMQQVTTGSITRILDHKSIVYLHIEREYVTAYLTDTQVTWRESLKQLLPRLKPGWFVQIHKSYAINRLLLQSYNTCTLEATMSNGVMLPISRRMMKRLKSVELG